MWIHVETTTNSRDKMKGIPLLLLWTVLAAMTALAEVLTDKACYTSADNGILVSFTDAPRVDDWVAIVPLGSVTTLIQDEYEVWSWKCGDQCPEASGRVFLENTLSNGDWVAVLAENADPPPYPIIALSDPFQVRDDCGEQSGEEIEFRVDGSSFEVGDAFFVEYSNYQAVANDDFIAIFDASIPSNQLPASGLLWRWVCNKQGSPCTNASPDGRVRFRSSSEWAEGNWPLPAGGSYKAYMLRNLSPEPFWPIVEAESEVFSVVEPPSVDESEVALNALSDAKVEIERLIDQDRTIAAKFVRLIFHDCIGGCDGCVDLSNRDNGGLDVPIEALQPVVDRHAVPGIVSRADIWALSAFVACDKLQSRIDYDMEWFGRLDCEEKHSVCLDADGNDTPCTATRGPHHDHPTIHVNTRDLYKFFEDEFGFNIRETVVVMGAHTLGALAEENSGIDGPNGWVVTNDVLDEEYYLELIGGDEPDAPLEELVDGAPPWRRAIESPNNGFDDLRIWTGLPLPDVRIIMLNADIALVRNLTDENYDSDIGRANCAFIDRFSTEDLPRCPHFEEAVRIGAEFKHDLTGWLREFRDVMETMATNGYQRTNCDGEVCRLIS